MSGSEIILLSGGIVLALSALWIGFCLLRMALIGAVVLFAFASEQGFVGIAVYIACWVFMFPVMLVICIVLGFTNNN